MTAPQDNLTTLDFGPEPHSPVTQWAKRVFHTLAAERAAQFETWKAKQR